MTAAAPFRSVQRVYFDDLDALNLLHNMRYLLFMERARGELFNSLGFRWQDDVSANPDKYHVVAAHSIDYLRPIRGEGMIAIELSPTHLGRSSLAIEARVSNDSGLCARGTTRLVRLDPKDDRPCAWSERFRAAILPLVAPARTE